MTLKIFNTGNSPAASPLCRAIAIIACAAWLGACSLHESTVASGNLEQQANAGETGKPAWMASFASTDRAQVSLTRLPDAAGSVRDVRQHLYSNGMRQVASLATKLKAPFASAVEIEIQLTGKAGLDDPLSLAKPTEASVRSQIGATFPALPMRIVTEPRANQYGPYGLAVGKSNDGIRCIFAWQWIDRNTALAKVGFDAAVSLRIHLCGPDATLDQLAGYIDALEIRQEGFAVESAAMTAAPVRRLAAKPPSPRYRTATQPARRDDPTGFISRANGTATYLAPVAVTANALQGDSGTPAALDPTLPAEAFRGPSSRK